MSRMQIIAIVVLGVVTTGIVGVERLISHKAKQVGLPARARADGSGIPVRTSLVTQTTQDILVGATALTAASAKATITIGSPTQFNSPVLHVRALGKNAADGAYVRAGELLVELDATTFDAFATERAALLAGAKAGLTLAEALPVQRDEDRKFEVAAAQNEVKFRTEDVGWTKKQLDRLQNLYDRRIATVYELYLAQERHSDSVFKLNEAETRLQRAKSSLVIGPATETMNLEQSKAAVATGELQLALAQRDAGIAKISSPISGYVQKFGIVANQTAAAGTVVCEVLQLDPIWVTIDYPQERLTELKLGQSVSLRLDAYPKEQFQGSVFQILPEVDSHLRTIPVRVAVPNGNGRIKAGVSGRATISVQRGATTAPSVSLIELDQKAMVFVVENGRARIREVRTGPVVSNGFVEVLEGLHAGEEIVIFGHQYLKDNEPVNSDWKKWTLRG